LWDTTGVLGYPYMNRFTVKAGALASGFAKNPAGALVRARTHEKK